MNLGFGTMMHYLSGGSEIDSQELYGKIITKAWFDEERNKVYLSFKDGLTVSIWDNGQSCCEYRYITMDDDPSVLGGELLSIEVKEGPTISKGYLPHEQVFVEITSRNGWITFCTHNEHNGYYGGFGLTITKES